MMSGNAVMEKQLSLLLKSLSSYGCLSDYYFTVFIPNSDVIKNRFIRLNTEIIKYTPDDRFAKPWTKVCRWNLKPKGNLVVGIDSDVVAWNDLNGLMKNCFKFNGMSARIAPFPQSAYHLKPSEWSFLFKNCKIEPNSFDCNYVNESNKKCIYYVNNGIITLSPDLVEGFKHEVNYCLNIANEYFRNSGFLPQIANTLAIYKSQINKRVMNKNFNFVSLVDGIPNDETLFYHYGCGIGGGSLDWRSNRYLKKKFSISLFN
jgi:hypothetical protein